MDTPTDRALLDVMPAVSLAFIAAVPQDSAQVVLLAVGTTIPNVTIRSPDVNSRALGSSCSTRASRLPGLNHTILADPCLVAAQRMAPLPVP